MSALKNLSATSVIVMAVFILSIVSAQNEIKVSSQSDLESLHEIQELLRNVQIVYEMNIARKVHQRAVEDETNDENDVHEDPNGCICSGLKCICCKYIRVYKLNLEDNCCLSLTYHPHNLEILISLKVGSRSLFSKGISARDPDTVCIGIPHKRQGGSVCIQFYSVNVAEKSVSGCSTFLARLLSVTVAKLELGCFRMSFLNDTKQLGAVELPYIDGQKAPVDGPEPLYLGEVGMEKIKPSDYEKK